MDSQADSIHIHDAGADQYDRQVEAYESYAHDLLFGMSYEFVRPGQRIVDLGIGTGLSSQPFARAGLEVYGADGSAEMLRVCRAKGFARELRRLDLGASPWPYADRFFAHAVSCGVLHFFGDLAPVLREVSRILDQGGVFAFTVAVPPRAGDGRGEAVTGFVGLDTPWGVRTFAHADGYVRGLLGGQGLRVLKRQRFLVRGAAESEPDGVFAAYVAGMRTD